MRHPEWGPAPGPGAGVGVRVVEALEWLRRVSGLETVAAAAPSSPSARADTRLSVHSSGDGELSLTQWSIPFQNTLKSVVKYLSCLKYLRNL